MKIAALVLTLILGQSDKSGQPIQNSELPLAPLDRKQIIVASDLDFNLAPAIDRAFDPNKEIPDTDTLPNGAFEVQLKPTPSKYIVTDDVMLEIIEPRKTESLFHTLEVIRYREKMPWKMIDRVTVLLFDHHVFAICIGDLENPSPEFSYDTNLRSIGQGATKLDIGQYESGTGAFNSHGAFELSAEGPKLVGISQGGRDH